MLSEFLSISWRIQFPSLSLSLCRSVELRQQNICYTCTAIIQFESMQFHTGLPTLPLSKHARAQSRMSEPDSDWRVELCWQNGALHKRIWRPSVAQRRHRQFHPVLGLVSVANFRTCASPIQVHARARAFSCTIHVAFSAQIVHDFVRII